MENGLLQTLEKCNALIWSEHKQLIKRQLTTTLV